MVIGAGATLLAPIVYPVVGTALRTAAKAVIKAGLVTYEGGKGLVNRSAAVLEDLTSEAKADLKGRGSSPKPGSKAAKPTGKAKKPAE
jgi:hypothetical protein